MAKTDEELWHKAETYASRHRIRLGERLGSGIHGMVLVAERHTETARTAIKIHREFEAYRKERAAYERLAERSISEVHGFHVPRMTGCDEELWIIEMTIVSKPFVLDFASASLDGPVNFPEEVWQEWEKEKREQFGYRWWQVHAVLGALEGLGIFMADVSPGNIAFLDEGSP